MENNRRQAHFQKETSAPVTVAKDGRGSSEVNKRKLALDGSNVKQNLCPLTP